MKQLKRSGFTIVESIIYMGVLSIMIFIMTELFLSVLDAQSEIESSVSTQRDGQFVVSRLAHDLGKASTVTTPTLGSSSSNLVASINGQNYSYQLSNGALTLSINGGTAEQLSSYNTTISQLSFLRIGNGIGKEDTIKVSFNIRSIIQRTAEQEIPYTTTVGLRSN